MKKSTQEPSVLSVSGCIPYVGPQKVEDGRDAWDGFRAGNNTNSLLKDQVQSCYSLDQSFSFYG